MKFSFGFQIGLMRFFRRIVIAYAPRFSVNSYVCAPFILETYNAKKAGFVSFIWLANVLSVAVLAYLTQIFKSVVRFISVYVVNKFDGPVTGHVKPRQTMRFVNLPVNADSDVPDPFFFAPGYIANTNTFSDALAPRKNACLRVIIKNLAKSIQSDFRHVILQTTANVYAKTIAVKGKPA